MTASRTALLVALFVLVAPAVAQPARLVRIGYLTPAITRATSASMGGFAHDPVRSGFVASFARPGGNITGLTVLSPEIAVKRLEMLRQVVPGVSRMAGLVNPSRASYQLRETEAAARTLGIQLQVAGVRSPAEYAAAFEAMSRQRAGALYVTPDPVFFRDQGRLIELAAKGRLPAVYDWKEFVEAGGLMSYGPSLTELNRRAAWYVDRILKGANPTDLPIERPAKFELTINLKVAKALELEIPPSLLLRADEVIQ